MRAPSRLIVAGAIALLALAGCSSADDEDPAATDDATPDATTGATSDATGDATGSGETVVVGGFNFPESTILMEIYAQALESAGLTVERQPDLGARELIFPELTSGSIDILPEYVGGAISSGFGEEPAGNTDEAVQQLTDLFSEEGVAVLEPAEAEDRDVFVVTADFAESNGISTLADLGDAGDLTVAGPPECEDRDTCFAGLVDTYGLDNLSFTSIQEKSPRLAALESGEAQVITLFSTDPVFTDGSLVALEDPEEMTPPQNVVPVVTQETLDASPEIEDVLNEVSAVLTTEGLAALNGQASEGQQPADVAAGWLEDNGLAG